MPTTEHHDHSHDSAVMREFGIVTRTISQALARLREQRARERATERRRAERDSDDIRRKQEARLDAQRAAVEAQLAPAFSADYLTAKTPEEIAEAYELARTWSEESPTAEAAAGAIRRDFEKLTGIDLEDADTRELNRRDRGQTERSAVYDVTTARDRADDAAEADREQDTDADRDAGFLATSKHNPAQGMSLRDLLIESGTPEQAVDARLDALRSFPLPTSSVLDQKPPTSGLKNDGDDYGLDSGRERDIER